MEAQRSRVKAERLCRFAELIGDRHLINSTVGPDLDPVLRSLHQAPDYRIERPGWVSLPYRYLGADDQAGPNYTGQPAVDSHYEVVEYTKR
jgi:hypothetical protein